MTREEASSVLDDYDVNFDGHTAEEIAEAFDVAFRALEQKPRKGKWKHIQYEETLCCSECGCRLVDEQTYIPLHYCPNCGAKMAESEDK